jgi:hypothetical protein
MGNMMEATKATFMQLDACGLAEAFAQSSANGDTPEGIFGNWK